MRLRNKKTGEIFDALVREKGGGGSYSLIVCDIKAYEQSKSTLDQTHFVLDEYETLAELNEEWEDYTPAEPLIKDEKIRKAVRAWAETVFEWGKWTENKIRVGYEGDDIYCFKIFDCLFEVPLSEKEKISDKEYTIAELCGEEEE